MFALANAEALSLGHSIVGTEHLLLALIGEGDGGASRALTDLGVSYSRTRAQIAEWKGSATPEPFRWLPFSGEANRAVHGAFGEADQLGHRFVWTGHLLLALASESDGMGSQLLTAQGVMPERVRQQVLKLLPEPESSRSSGSGRFGGMPGQLSDDLQVLMERLRQADPAERPHIMKQMSQVTHRVERTTLREALTMAAVDIVRRRPWRTHWSLGRKDPDSPVIYESGPASPSFRWERGAAAEARRRNEEQPLPNGWQWVPVAVDPEPPVFSEPAAPSG